MRIGFLLSVVLLSVPLPVGSLHQARRDTDIEQYTRERASMVAEQLRQRGISDARVLDVMRKVPRHLFVPESVRLLAYADRPLLSATVRRSRSRLSSPT